MSAPHNKYKAIDIISIWDTLYCPIENTCDVYSQANIVVILSKKHQNQWAFYLKKNH